MAYVSPEVLKGEPFNEKADIWALGCLLFELCCLRKAFDDNSEDELRQHILTYTIPSLPLLSIESRPSLVDLSHIYYHCMNR